MQHDNSVGACNRTTDVRHTTKQLAGKHVETIDVRHRKAMELTLVKGVL